ncbi:MAG: N-acetylmuramoyl-L-alanine amidase [Elusimicrobia bacterium]|nr:N-acetylmuramoyl-L-alanine amidase [Elusimicrobiota bacterium]
MRKTPAWNRFAPALLAAALAVPSLAMNPASPILPAPGQPMTPVIIDPGHGGDDEGAIVRGLREKDIALVFAKKLKARLARNADLPVVLTRDTDRYVTLDGRLVESVDMRGSIFVSLHLNQVRGRKSAGAVVYSYGPQKASKARRRRHPSVPPMPAAPRGQASDSERLARTFSRTLRGDGFRAESSKSDYYVLKNPAEPSVLIELGYLNNPDEAAKLNDPAYQDRMVDSLAKAIEEYATARTLRVDMPVATKVVSKR